VTKSKVERRHRNPTSMYQHENLEGGNKSYNQQGSNPRVDVEYRKLMYLYLRYKLCFVPRETPLV
jgi:hypothetical protein